MLGWPDAIVIIVVVVVVFLWTSRERLKRAVVKHGDTELILELQEKKLQRSLPVSGDRVFSKEELRIALESIPNSDSTKLDERMPGSNETLLDFAYDFLRRSGVVTVRQLEELIGSEEIRQTLSKIYIEELHRPASKPLDPIAVATWGSQLYLYGINEPTVTRVKEAIRRFPEYAQVRQLRSGPQKEWT